MWELDLYLCKQVRSQASRRITRWLDWDPTCLPLSLSFLIKNKNNFKVFNSRQHLKSIFRKLPSIQRVKPTSSEFWRLLMPFAANLGLQFSIHRRHCIHVLNTKIFPWDQPSYKVYTMNWQIAQEIVYMPPPPNYNPSKNTITIVGMIIELWLWLSVQDNHLTTTRTDFDRNS